MNYEILKTLCYCILQDNYHSLIASPNKEKSEKAKKYVDEILNHEVFDGVYDQSTDYVIRFKNGSTIEFTYSKEIDENKPIRGTRSKLPLLLFDYEYCNKEILDEVLEPYTKDVTQ